MLHALIFEDYMPLHLLAIGGGKLKILVEVPDRQQFEILQYSVVEFRNTNKEIEKHIYMVIYISLPIENL